jgi:hypothetical protein
MELVRRLGHGDVLRWEEAIRGLVRVYLHAALFRQHRVKTPVPAIADFRRNQESDLQERILKALYPAFPSVLRMFSRSMAGTLSELEALAEIKEALLICIMATPKGPAKQMIFVAVQEDSAKLRPAEGMTREDMVNSVVEAMLNRKRPPWVHVTTHGVGTDPSEIARDFLSQEIRKHWKDVRHLSLPIRPRTLSRWRAKGLVDRDGPVNIVQARQASEVCAKRKAGRVDGYMTLNDIAEVLFGYLHASTKKIQNTRSRKDLVRTTRTTVLRAFRKALDLGMRPPKRHHQNRAHLLTGEQVTTVLQCLPPHSRHRMLGLEDRHDGLPDKALRREVQDEFDEFLSAGWPEQ